MDKKMVNVGVGVSQKDDVIEAAREAAEEAKAKAKNPKLLMFYVTYNYPSEKYQEAVTEVQSVFSDDVRLVGGGVLGFMANDKAYDAWRTGGKVKAVTVLALESDYLNVGVGIGSEVDKNPQEAGRKSFLMALDDLEYNPSVAYMAMTQGGVRDLINVRPINALLLTPGITPNHMIIDQRILEGISDVAKRAVRLAGGGTQQFDPINVAFPGSFQFFNGKVYEESVVSILFGSDLEIGYGVGAGYEVLGGGAFITKGQDWTIEELNERPAFEVFKEMVAKYTDIKEEDVPDNLLKLADKGIQMGVSEPTGDFFWPNFFLAADGNKIITLQEIRKGLGMALLKFDKGYCVEGIKDSAKNMKEDAGVDSFDFTMFFSCGGRGSVMEEDYEKEAQAIKNTVKGDPVVFGLISCGEQGFYKTGSMMATKLNIPMIGISNKLIAEK